MVGLYFNTRNMSAILKALQNRKVEVELKSEVVELSIISDLSKSLANLKKQSTQVDNAMDKFFNMLYAARDAGKKVNGAAYLKELSNAKKIMSDLENMSKNLGVKPTDIDGYQEIKSLVFHSDDMKDNLKDTASQVSKIN